MAVLQALKNWSAFRHSAARQWAGVFEALLLLAFIGVADISELLPVRIAQLQPHPFWIPVILASCLYGRMVGYVIAVAAAMADAALVWPEAAGHSDFYGFLSARSVNAVLWLGAAVLLGSFRDEQAQRLREAEEALGQRASEAHVLADRCRSLILEVSKLENSVAASSGGKAGKALDVFGRMLALPAERAFDGYKQALRALIGAKGFDLLLPGGHNWPGASRLNDTWDGRESDRQSPDGQIFEKAVSNICGSVAASGRIFNCVRDSDREVLAGIAALAAPVYSSNGDLLAIVLVREADPSCLGQSAEAAISLANFVLGARFLEYELSASGDAARFGGAPQFLKSGQVAETGEILNALVQR